MVLVIVMFVLGIVAIVTAVVSAEDSLTQALVTAFMAICIFAALSFVQGPVTFGHSVVPWGAEDFTERLKTGIVYHVLGSKTAGKDDQVFLVEFDCGKDGGCRYRAVRVKAAAPPPEYFALIDGGAVAVAPEQFAVK